MRATNKAVFVDRDGVINPLAFNTATGEFEPPHTPFDFAIYPFAERALRTLKACGYHIVLVSNQPDAAKGKITMENLLRINGLLEAWANEHDSLIDKYCYCYHHPNGIVPEYTCQCDCRKPGTLFLEQAAVEFSLDSAACWFIGDRFSDVECGKRFGCRTIKIENPHEGNISNNIEADYCAENLMQAAEIIANIE